MEITINVIKFEVVDGRKTGKSFSFGMDPKEMAKKCKTEATLKKQIEQYISKSGVFKRSELKELRYDMKAFLEEWKKQLPIIKEEELKNLEASPNVPDLHYGGVAKEYDLERFLIAHAADYDDALQEIRSGRKRGHWIWYIFPQQKGLGHSYNSKYYGLDGMDEARAYLAHPVLGARLREISEALLIHEGKRDIDAIMGSKIDVLKLLTCMNLFNHVSPNDIFKKVLDAFF
jgi:uncharacterized protein (DUF1810 family)